MENAYLLNLCVFLIIAVFPSYLFNKRDHLGRLEKKEFLKIVLPAPFLILLSFYVGRFFEGNSLKFILILGPTAMLWLYLVVKPKALKEYDPMVKRYGGLSMAVILAFLLTG